MNNIEHKCPESNPHSCFEFFAVNFKSTPSLEEEEEDLDLE
jgi:hypothetical protein